MFCFVFYCSIAFGALTGSFKDRVKAGNLNKLSTYSLSSGSNVGLSPGKLVVACHWNTLMWPL